MAGARRYEGVLCNNSEKGEERRGKMKEIIDKLGSSKAFCRGIPDLQFKNIILAAM